MNFPLPRHSHIALNAAAILVPAGERENWRRLWHAELWHAQHHRSAHRLTAPRRALRALDLTFGLFSDAAWLRAESVRLRFSGSPLLCIASLAALCIIAAAFAFRISGLDSRVLFLSYLSHQFWSCFCPAALVAVFGQLGLSRDHRGPAAPGPRWSLDRVCVRILRINFFAVKLALAACFVFLLGIDLLGPFHDISRAGIPQIYLTAVLLTIALRWASLDQQRRCRRCLHTLTNPARVGRPSHNFLEWNGTESTCRHGHGALHQPEHETSWHEAARWVTS